MNNRQQQDKKHKRIQRQKISWHLPVMYRKSWGQACGMLFVIVSLIGMVSCDDGTSTFGSEAIASTENAQKKEQQAPLVITTSIAPLYSILMNLVPESASNGVNTDAEQRAIEVNFLVPATRSPHAMQLKPSQRALLARSDVVFYIGHGFEPFIDKVLPQLSAEAISLSERVLSRVEMNALTEHEWHEEEKIKPGLGDNEETHAEDEHGTNEGHEDNLHIWLSLQKTKHIAEEMTQVLIAHFPSRRAELMARLMKFTAELTRLNATITAQLANHHHKNYLVYHDAYRYFEADYGLQASGIILQKGRSLLSPQHLKALQDIVASQDIACLYFEPQFKQTPIYKASYNVFKRQHVKILTLDPIGAELGANAQLYTSLIQNMANTFSECFTD